MIVAAAASASVQLRTKASDNSTLLIKAQMAPCEHKSSKIDLDWLKIAVSKAIVLKYKSSSNNLKHGGWTLFFEKIPSNYQIHAK